MNQDAVYWAPLDIGEDGRWTYDDPVDIVCMWQDTQEIYNALAGGAIVQQVSNAIVMVDRDLLTGGRLFLGTLNQVDNPTDPASNDRAWQIMRTQKFPDPDAQTFARFAIL